MRLFNERRKHPVKQPQKYSKALRDKWYRKLAKSGFVDAEDVNSPNEMLKRWHGSYFRDHMTPQEFKAKEAYFQNATWFLTVHKFISKDERKIWKLHAEGQNVVEIAKTMDLKRTKTSLIIQRLGGLMNGLLIRDAVADDLNFIYATWLRGLYYASAFYSAIEKDVFFKEYESVIKRILAKEGVVVKVSCLKEAPDVVLGYAIFEPQRALHYVFVKQVWRRQGLAKELVPNDLINVTHLTELGQLIAKKKNLKLNPWLI